MASFLDLFYSPVRHRFPTREIRIGNLSLGGSNPVRIQSMTNTDTNDVASTVRQVIDLANAGCEMVRITAQGEREVRNLALVKREIRRKGYTTPLIADIHFNPKAAEIAACIVEKIRINPGNYVNKGNKASFTHREYELELEKIAEKLSPLLKICNDNGTAIRIGTNHGSLSSRIVDRYGDTPLGMVESALEFARICAAEGFRNLVLSMKSSNVRVMVQATRLLVERMYGENMNFPLHIGVTEAGDGEDGIIKSAAGIGALLEDGIGDTIRVSLTGDPLKEIPVARKIVSRYNSHTDLEHGTAVTLPVTGFDPFTYNKIPVIPKGTFGGSNPIQVVTRYEGMYHIISDTYEREKILTNQELKDTTVFSGEFRAMRNAAMKSLAGGECLPLILLKEFPFTDLLSFQVDASIDLGTLLLDGIGDAICPIAPAISEKEVNQVAFGILQATRSRITRTEYIACPSCGRTLFDLEKTLAAVKEATAHLKGLKIAVMGCIVNGPGEMADADYGYVGAGPGRVTLYKGKEVVLKGITENDAISELKRIIKENGDWKEG